MISTVKSFAVIPHCTEDTFTIKQMDR